MFFSKRQTILFIALLCSGFYSAWAQPHFPENYIPIREYIEQTMWDLPEIPEEYIDVGLWALVIAKEFDPEVDIESNLQSLDSMAAEINRMLAGRDKDIEKTSMTRTFLYESGVWNNHHPFTYDLDDPLGKRPENQLLNSYLTSRKGNCLSMPVLFIALMERLDPDVPFHAVRAPLHLFCRLRDRQNGDIWNVETTNGGHPARNQWYIETLNIPQKAIDSGLYLQDLTKKELLADLLQPLIYKYRVKEDYATALKYADLALQIDSTSTVGLVSKGALYACLGYNIAEKARNEQRSLTPSDRIKVNRYKMQSKKYIDIAIARGWQPETQEQQRDYLSTIRKQKEKKESN